MKPQYIPVLKHLGLRGGVNDYIPISSRELSDVLNISQQSASKRILELINEGMIVRQLGARKQLIKLTDKGVQVLRQEYADYQRLFEFINRVRIRGIVTSGMGEGHYYITQKGYMEQFRKKLWFYPYEGTLNLRVPQEELSKLHILREAVGIPIEGFRNAERTFGKGKCFFATIQNLECAVIMPTRSHYNDVIEIISKHYLRGTLGLKDGDVVEVEVTL
jgi:riboflavin kinase